jgi:U1 small nuclear ribonucleoprotein C
MPRYYCDYCDTYLTHDSVCGATKATIDRVRPCTDFVALKSRQQAGRKQHNRGWKHRENVKLYYEQFVTGIGQGGIMMRALESLFFTSAHNTSYELTSLYGI